MRPEQKGKLVHAIGRAVKHCRECESRLTDAETECRLKQLRAVLERQRLEALALADDDPDDSLFRMEMARAYPIGLNEGAISTELMISLLGDRAGELGDVPTVVEFSALVALCIDRWRR